MVRGESGAEVSDPMVVPATPTPKRNGAVVVSPDDLSEDSAAWDCRTMGNRECGVLVVDTWYVVTFDGRGEPVAIRTR